MTAPLHLRLRKSGSSLGLVSTAIAFPFARRDDWFGWVALLWITSFAIALWAILIFGIARNALVWHWDKPSVDDNTDTGPCYEGHIYQLASGS